MSPTQSSGTIVLSPYEKLSTIEARTQPLVVQPQMITVSTRFLSNAYQGSQEEDRRSGFREAHVIGVS